MELVPAAWALLGMLHRAKHGGPREPGGFVFEYAELHAKGLVLHIGDRVMITIAGETALRERYLADE